MKLYMAPMEGVTGFVYRRAYHACFGPMDRYFTPFIAPKGQGADGQTEGGRRVCMSAREKRDVLPEHNAGMAVVPQILTNWAEDFLQTAALLGEMGYREVNLNLGCPSGTVTAKGKGAGFLAFPERLEEFFRQVSPGFSAGYGAFGENQAGGGRTGEFERLLEIYNQFPLTELIIHPRVLRTIMEMNPVLIGLPMPCPPPGRRCAITGISVSRGFGALKGASGRKAPGPGDAGAGDYPQPRPGRGDQGAEACGLG